MVTSRLAPLLISIIVILVLGRANAAPSIVQSCAQLAAAENFEAARHIIVEELRAAQISAPISDAMVLRVLEVKAYTFIKRFQYSVLWRVYAYFESSPMLATDTHTWIEASTMLTEGGVFDGEDANKVMKSKINKTFSFPFNAGVSKAIQEFVAVTKGMIIEMLYVTQEKSAMYSEVSGRLEALSLATMAASRQWNATGSIMAAQHKEIIDLSSKLKKDPYRLGRDLESSDDGARWHALAKGEIAETGRIVASVDAARAQEPAKLQSQTAPPRAPGQVTLDDVAGLDELKHEIGRTIIFPMQYPDVAAQYQIKAGGGILLYGPPGNGKTLIAKAIAGSIKAEFIAISSADIVTKWLGESGANIKALFTKARGLAAQGKRVVIFMDEVDALAGDRSGSGNDGGSQERRAVVNQLLSELDGFGTNNKNILFLAATNAPWLLDKAFLRPGRIDSTVLVPMPDAVSINKILSLKLKDRPVEPGLFDKLPQIAQDLFARGYSGAEVAVIGTRAAKYAFDEALKNFNPQTGESPPIVPISEAHLTRAVEDTSARTDLDMLQRLRAWGAERMVD